tara:strand:+ start:18831 stop:19175 length:345 start_codon:yes stop_codon:yes gene_type:complete
MHASHTSTDPKQLWTMKEAAKDLGVGLPRLYERLREKGLFTRLGVDGRNMPIRRLQDEKLFVVEPSAWWDKQCGVWRPCPKVHATYHGLILLQEIADELERERNKPAETRATPE